MLRQLISGLVIATAAPALAAGPYQPVFGGPYGSQYNFSDTSFGRGLSAGSGVAVGYVTKTVPIVYNGMPSQAYVTVPLRWNSAGQSEELNGLAVAPNGLWSGRALAINSANTAVGSVSTISSFAGTTAVRWAGSPTPTGLSTAGDGDLANPFSEAVAINENGTASGYSEVYVNGIGQGYRAVRWEAGSTTPFILNNPSTGLYGRALAISNTNIAAGRFAKYSGTTQLGFRGVRWNADGTPTELGTLGDESGPTNSEAVAVNNAGTAIGYSSMFTGGKYNGSRPVRWDANSSITTELGNLGVDQYGYPSAQAFDINISGTIIGHSTRFVNANSLGVRAVKWNAGSTTAVELDILSLSSNGGGYANAFAINDNGLAVGFCQMYSGGTFLGNHAALWQQDGSVVDLNSLIDPASGWTLSEAYSISQTNWVAGLGFFDPDGAGPLVGSTRPFLIQVPEPGGIVLATLAGFGVRRRRRVD